MHQSDKIVVWACGLSLLAFAAIEVNRAFTLPFNIAVVLVVIVGWFIQDRLVLKLAKPQYIKTLRITGLLVAILHLGLFPTEAKAQSYICNTAGWIAHDNRILAREGKDLRLSTGSGMAKLMFDRAAWFGYNSKADPSQVRKMAVQECMAFESQLTKGK